MVTKYSLHTLWMWYYIITVWWNAFVKVRADVVNVTSTRLFLIGCFMRWGWWWWWEWIFHNMSAFLLPLFCCYSWLSFFTLFRYIRILLSIFWILEWVYGRFLTVIYRNVVSIILQFTEHFELMCHPHICILCLFGRCVGLGNWHHSVLRNLGKIHVMSG